jgi:threonine dehydrogenase-like Zn-dependent dehydrogenase
VGFEGVNFSRMVGVRYRTASERVVLDGKINPGKVFDLPLPLNEIAEAYCAMDERPQ